MAESVFLVDIDAPKGTVRRALTTHDGIVGWWTDDAERSDGVMSLGFADAPERFSLRIDTESDERVQWTSIGQFPPHWADTEIVWSLMDNPDAGGSRVFFEHTGFAAPDPMLGHTAMTWAHLMDSLKKYSETGESDPMLTGTS